MPEPASILIVASNVQNLELLEQVLGKEGYRTQGASTLEEFVQLLDGVPLPALALVDVGGFDQRIWDPCDRLRQGGVPFLLISPGDATAIQEEGLAHGARGILTKPLASRELLNLIRSLVTSS